MCGINGAYFTDSTKEINRTLFEESLKSLAHRGPDNQSSFISGGIALGHNRLSIIDVSAASHQPFFSTNRKFAIVFNGEIFNYKELKRELELAGEIFATHSDTEIILSLLIKHGINALHKINGFFAFAFYDFNKHELLIARDRFGEKPLFYSLSGDNSSIVFGSELCAVAPFVPNKKLNQTALDLLLRLTYIPAPYTIIDGVNKLEPGCYLRISKQDYTTQKWYAVKKNSYSTIVDEKSVLKEVNTKFNLAVERRMVSDVPVAGFLSGGIDSTLVCSRAKKINNEFETFSLGFENNSFFDESKDAMRVADKFGIHHNQIILSENEMLENVYELLHANDEPFGDSSIIALFSLCKKIKGKYKVILSGDGADEVFAGYNKHYALNKASKKSASNFLIKNMGGIHKAFPKSRNGKFANKVRQLQKMHQSLKRNDFERYWYLAQFNSEFVNRINNESNELNTFKEKLKSKNTFDDFNKFLLYDLELVLPNDMLYKVDRASMLNGIEIRSPFMDHELIEFAFSIPGSFKVKNGIQKYLLKTAFKDVLSPDILNKPKHGFEVPLQKWLIGPLKSEVGKLLNEEFILQQNIFNPQIISLLVKKLNSKNPGDSSSTVWALLQFQNSWKKYFNA